MCLLQACADVSDLLPVRQLTNVNYLLCACTHCCDIAVKEDHHCSSDHIKNLPSSAKHYRAEPLSQGPKGFDEPCVNTHAWRDVVVAAFCHLAALYKMAFSLPQSLPRPRPRGRARGRARSWARRPGSHAGPCRRALLPPASAAHLHSALHLRLRNYIKRAALLRFFTCAWHKLPARWCQLKSTCEASHRLHDAEPACSWMVLDQHCWW